MNSGPVGAGVDPGFFTPKIFFPFLLVSLIWGSTWLVIHDQLGTVPVAWSISYRFGVAAIGMFGLTLYMRVPITLDFSGQCWAMLLGFTQFTLNFNLVYVAEKYVTSGLVAVIFALLIIPNALLGKRLLGRPVARSFWLGSTIACAGVGFLMVQEYRFASIGETSVLIGIGLALMAVMSASISNIIQASPRVDRYSTVTLLSWSMLWGTLANAVFAMATSGPPTLELRGTYLGGILYLGLIGSVVTFPLYFNLIRQIGPGKAAYTSVLIPVVAMTLSTIFEGYFWSWFAISGAILVMIGLLVAMQARKPSA